MISDPKLLYLDLLKKSLTDFHRANCLFSKYANAMPLEWVLPESVVKGAREWKLIQLKIKKFCRFILISFFAKFELLITKHDQLTDAKRIEYRQTGKEWPAYAYTMVGLKRLDNVQFLVEMILKNNVPGDFIETGVWRGGSSIFMCGVLRAYGIQDRKVWVCDSFEGLPPPEPKKYPHDTGDNLSTYNILSVPQEIVENNFRLFNLLDSNVVFVKGFFEETLSKIQAERFALIRLDGDMYSSTIVALKELYDKLSPQGYIIIDDYALLGCKKAVEDFRRDRNIQDEIIKINDLAAYWQKSG
jgi:O-methyltransferase